MFYGDKDKRETDNKVGKGYGKGSESESSMNKPYYRRMDIILVDFGEDFDSCVIGDFRPAIVISKTSYNKVSPVMQVLPLTKKLKAIDRDYHIFVDRMDCKDYEASGICMVEQITTVDRQQVRRKIAEVTEPRLIAKLESAMVRHLGIERATED